MFHEIRVMGSANQRLRLGVLISGGGRTLQNFVELTDPMWHRLESIDRMLLRRIPAARRVCRLAVVTLALPTKGA